MKSVSLACDVDPAGSTYTVASRPQLDSTSNFRWDDPVTARCALSGRYGPFDDAETPLPCRVGIAACAGVRVSSPHLGMRCGGIRLSPVFLYGILYRTVNRKSTAPRFGPSL